MRDRDGPRQGVDAHEPLRVVIADDDALTRRMVRDALQDAGVVVIAEAGGGREAIELCLYYKPDVVLMDIVMPDLDGLAATRHRRRPGPPLPAQEAGAGPLAGVGATRCRNPTMRALISCGRSTSMKWPTPSMSSESDPGPQ